jgi:hypothetical protein
MRPRPLIKDDLIPDEDSFSFSGQPAGKEQTLSKMLSELLRCILLASLLHNTRAMLIVLLARYPELITMSAKSNVGTATCLHT